jgi:hypothetical protein
MAATGKDGNPLAHVLQAIGEPLDLIEYDQWNVLLPEGSFVTFVGDDQFTEVLQQVWPRCSVAASTDGAMTVWNGIDRTSDKV